METIRLTRDLKRDEGIPDWNLVQIGCVPDGRDAALFFEAEAVLLRGIDTKAAPLATIVRLETLRTTPQSHSPTAIDSLVSRRDDIRISVECINVKHEALERYQELMMLNAGPATRELRDEGFIYSFTPLETDTVLFEASGMPAWNQLHVLAFLPENIEGFTDRFSEAILKANPDSGGYEGYFAELDEIRNRPRWSFGLYLPELRVE
jgi:hypothetical protein